MKYILKLIPATESSELEGNWHSLHGYDFWYSPLFLEAIEELHGLKSYILKVYKGEELIAMLPLFERRRFSMKALVCPVAAYYQGLHFFFDPATSAPRVLLDSLAISTEIARFLAKEYTRINFKLHPGNEDLRGFTWNKFQARPMFTFRHCLSEELAMLQDEKKSLRKAQAACMELQESFDPDAFFRLQREMDARKGHDLGLDYDKLGKFFERMRQQKMLLQYNVILDSKTVSSNVMYEDGGKVAYTVFQASDPQAMKKGAAAFHSVEILKSLPQNCELFDYCGANVPDVARFKAALGLSLKVFYHVSL